MERKRTGSHSSHPSKSETKSRKKKAKLTLKPPSFITASQAKPKKPVRSFDAFLETLLDPELIEEDVLILLTHFIEETEAGSPEMTVVKDMDQCMVLLEKVYKSHWGDWFGLLFSLLFDVLVLLVNTLDGPLPQSVVEFAPTTVKQRMFGTCTLLLCVCRR